MQQQAADVTRVTAWRSVPQGETARHARSPSNPAPEAHRGNDKEAQFADHVAINITGPVLRYSQRVALINEAGRREIGRFQANLIIASVLHERGMGQAYEVPPERGAPGWRPVLAAVAIVQAAIATGAWWVFH
jgi:hypothetical protein